MIWVALFCFDNLCSVLVFRLSSVLEVLPCHISVHNLPPYFASRHPFSLPCSSSTPGTHTVTTPVYPTPCTIRQASCTLNPSFFAPITLQIAIFHHSYPSPSLPTVALNTQTYKPIYHSPPRTIHAHGHLHPPYFRRHFFFVCFSLSFSWASSPAMQGARCLRRLMQDGVHLELPVTTTSPLAVGAIESAKMRILCLVSENPCHHLQPPPPLPPSSLLHAPRQ